MKSHNIHITFLRDNGSDEVDVVISAPNLSVTREDIKAALKTGYAAGAYKANGNSPITLVEYTCRKHGWGWKHFQFDEYLCFG